MASEAFDPGTPGVLESGRVDSVAEHVVGIGDLQVGRVLLVLHGQFEEASS